MARKTETRLMVEEAMREAGLVPAYIIMYADKNVNNIHFKFGRERKAVYPDRVFTYYSKLGMEHKDIAKLVAKLPASIDYMLTDYGMKIFNFIADECIKDTPVNVSLKTKLAEYIQSEFKPGREDQREDAICDVLQDIAQLAGLSIAVDEKTTYTVKVF